MAFYLLSFPFFNASIRYGMSGENRETVVAPGEEIPKGIGNLPEGPETFSVGAREKHPNPSAFILQGLAG
jgi:hypothetical protein